MSGVQLVNIGLHSVDVPRNTREEAEALAEIFKSQRDSVCPCQLLAEVPIHSRCPYTSSMPRVLMNFQHNNGWTAHFLKADCRTPASRRFYYFESFDALRQIFVRANSPAETFATFDHDVRAWARAASISISPPSSTAV
jgi:hypothetical protein